MTEAPGPRATHILDREAPEPHRSLRYGPGETGVADVFPPAGAGRGLLLSTAAWRNRYDRIPAPLCRPRAEGGRSPCQYRRVGDPGGNWPGSLEDVVAAVSTRGRLSKAPPRSSATRGGAPRAAAALAGAASSRSRASSTSRRPAGTGCPRAPPTVPGTGRAGAIDPDPMLRALPAAPSS